MFYCTRRWKTHAFQIVAVDRRLEMVSNGTSPVSREHDEAFLTHKLKNPDTLINLFYRLERAAQASSSEVK